MKADTEAKLMTISVYFLIAASTSVVGWTIINECMQLDKKDRCLMTEHEKSLLKEKKIAEAKKAGEQAGRLGLSEHCRPWSYYGGPGCDEGNAWEKAYNEAKNNKQ